jgi:hypothetical protein
MLFGNRYAIWIQPDMNRRRDVHTTSSRTRFGSFEFLVPFCLSNAPPIFQPLLNDALREYLNVWCILNLGDIRIYSHTPEEHLEHIELVFKKLRKHKLYVMCSNRMYMRKELDYLDHVVSGLGISVGPSKI